MEAGRVKRCFVHMRFLFVGESCWADGRIRIFGEVLGSLREIYE